MNKQHNILRLWKDVAPRTGLRGNPLKIYPQAANSKLRRNSFAIRVPKIWNNLPDSVTSAKTVNTFKNRLDKFWANQDLMYDDYKASIITTGSNKEDNKESDEEDP